MAQQLIVNGLVVTGGDNSKVIPGGAVCYDGATIVEVGTTADLEKKYPAAQKRNVNGMVVMPGFICAHHHFYSTMARGMGIPGTPAANFVEVLERLWWKVDYALTMEDVKYSALIPLAECIRNGTTSIIDHHAGPSCREGSLDVIADTVKQAGLRASLCYEVSDRNVAGGGVDENLRFIRRCQKEKDPQLAALLGLHASFTVGDATLERCAAEARALGAGFHTHVAEDKSDVEHCQKTYGMGVVERFHKFGVTGEKSIFVHCIHIAEKEMEILAATKTAAVHNPESNMNNAVGAAKVLTMLKKGVLVGLGTDGMGSDMPVQMRCGYLLHRHEQRDPRVAFCEMPQLLLQNNRTIANRQFSVKVGELAAGCAADIIVVDYIPPTPFGSDNFLGHFIFGMVDATVDTTIGSGKVLMEGKKIVSLDEQAIAAKSRELAPKMWARRRAND
ncbi:MAG TPA: putative aminohydrolase SsnA [bacterium]|nr:putative aminohydrolase SsnA [bacterium]